MEKAAGSGTNQNTLSTSPSPNVKVEQPALLEATSVLSVTKENVHEQTQPTPQPIASRSVTPTEKATAPPAGFLGLTSQVGTWLDRNLSLVYQKAKVLKRDSEIFHGLAGSSSDKPMHIHDASRLFKEHFELMEEYFGYLDKHPDEQEFLKQYAQGKPCSSRSELAYEQMHSEILSQLQLLYSLPKNFSFNYDIAKALATHFYTTTAQVLQVLQGADPSPSRPTPTLTSPITQAIGNQTPDQVISKMLRLTECLFQCPGFNNSNQSPEKKLRLSAQYLIDTGFNLSELKQAGIPVEVLLEKSIKLCTKMSGFLDKIDDYMLDVLLQAQPDKQYWYITGSLRFSYFLRHPSSTCRLLYHLSNLSEPPSGINRTALMKELMRLIEKSRGEWTPFQAAIFALQDKGWFYDKLTVAEMSQLQELLASINAGDYPSEQRTLPTPAPITPEQWMLVPCPSRFQGDYKPTRAQSYHSLPAISSLWSDIRALPCMSDSLPDIDHSIGLYLSRCPDMTRLEEISEKAHGLWKKVSNIDGAQEEHQTSYQAKRPTQWVKSAKELLHDYKGYLDAHPQELLLIYGAASYNKKHHLKAQNLLATHYHLQHLSFLYRRGLFGTKATRDAITQPAQSALKDTSSQSRAKKINAAVSSFKKLQQDHTEIIAGRFLLARCFLAQKWQTKEIAMFVEETSQDMLDCLADCYQIILELERLVKPDQHKQGRRLIEQLKTCLVQGDLYKNIALSSKIWPAINPEIGPDWEIESLCIQLLGSTESITPLLASLDKIEGVAVCPYDLQHPLFHVLTQRFEEPFCQVDGAKSTPAISDEDYEEIHAISHSMCHGFLLKQWFDFLIKCDNHIPKECDLLSRVRKHKPAIDKRTVEQLEKEQQRQSRLVKELEQAAIQKVPAKKKKPKQLFTPVTAACWEAPKAPRKARVEVISEQEQLLRAAEGMIRNMPETAIKEMKKLQMHFQNYPDLHVRIRVGLAEAALMRLEPYLKRMTRLEKKAEQFLLLLKAAHDTEPHTFPDHCFYGTMVNEFQKMPDICGTLKTLLDETIPHISAQLQEAAKLQVDTDIQTLVKERCAKVLQETRRALNVITQLHACIEQRKKLNAKRSEYLRNNPGIVNQSKAAEALKPTKEVFQEAEQPLRETQRALTKLVKLAPAPNEGSARKPLTRINSPL